MDYVNGLGAAGIVVDRLSELPTYRVGSTVGTGRGAHSAEREIPLFLGIRGICHRSRR
jgi:hypothetical protein